MLKCNGGGDVEVARVRGKVFLKVRSQGECRNRIIKGKVREAVGVLAGNQFMKYWKIINVKKNLNNDLPCNGGGIDPIRPAMPPS